MCGNVLSRTLARHASFGWVLAAVLCAAPAAAAPVPAERANARQLYFEGMKKQRAGDLEGAHRAFLAADGIMHVPTTALRLAEVQIATGALVEALDSLDRATQYRSAEPIPAAQEQARQSARELRSTLLPRIPSLVVSIEGDADDEHVSVTVDGRPLPSALHGAPYLVNASAHVVELRVDDRVVESYDVLLAEGERRALALHVPARDREPEAKPVASAAPATPVVEVAKASATHDATRSEPKPWVRPAIIGAGALAVAGIAVGTIGGIMTLNARATAEEKCPGRSCPVGGAGELALEDAQTYATLSTAGWITAGVAVAAGVGVWLMSSHRATTKPAVALVGAGGAQISF